MPATTTEGTGQGSAEGPLRGFDLDKMSKVLIGQLDALRSSIELVNGKPKLRVGADQVTIDDSGLSVSANTVQDAINALDSSGSVSNYLLIYRPGGVQSGNVYDNWPDLYAKFQQTEGLILIQIDSNTYAMPATITAGTWDLEKRVIFVSPYTVVNYLEFADNCYLENVNAFNGRIWIVQNGSTTPITITDTQVIYFDTEILATNPGSAPLLEVTSTGDLDLWCNKVFLGFKAHVDGGLSIYGLTGSNISPSLTGTGGVGIYLDTSSEASNTVFSGFTGSPALKASIGPATNYTHEFDNTNLIANVLTVPHNLLVGYENQTGFVNINLYNPSGELVPFASSPSTPYVTIVDEGTLTITFTGPITAGTWHAYVTKGYS